MSARLALGADKVAKAIADIARRPRRGRHDRSQRLARHVLPRAADRSRNACRPHRLWPGCAARTSPRSSMPTSSMAARIALRIGRPEDHPYLARQTRLTFARCGITDPISLEDYAAHDGWRGLKRAIEIGAAAIVDESHAIGPARPRRRGLPDRHQMEDGRRHQGRSQICRLQCDEGDSGTFADRMVIEDDPFMLIEGMTICAVAVGATKGYVYCRSEYPHGDQGLQRSARRARAAPAGSASHVSARAIASTSSCASAPAPMSAARRPRCSKASKASAAWCAPSRRCRPIRACSSSRPSSTMCCRLRPRPSFSRKAPKPMPISAWAVRAGRCRCRSPAMSATAACSRPAFGLTLGEIVEDIGGGTASGRPVRAVQCGGPLGAYFPPSLFDTPFDYEAFAAQGRADRPRRPRRLRRHGRYGRNGAFRDGVLRHRKLRQVHALPHRLDARPGGHRTHHARRPTSMPI